VSTRLRFGLDLRQGARWSLPFHFVEAALRTRVPVDGWRTVSMFDVMMVAIALGFFVIALGYVAACDRM